MLGNTSSGHPSALTRSTAFNGSSRTIAIVPAGRGKGAQVDLEEFANRLAGCLTSVVNRDNGNPDLSSKGIGGHFRNVSRASGVSSHGSVGAGLSSWGNVSANRNSGSLRNGSPPGLRGKTPLTHAASFVARRSMESSARASSFLNSSHHAAAGVIAVQPRNAVPAAASLPGEFSGACVLTSRVAQNASGRAPPSASAVPSSGWWRNEADHVWRAKTTAVISEAEEHYRFVLLVADP